MNTTFSVYRYWFCFIYLFYDEIRSYSPPLTFRWGTWLDSLCVFSVPRRSSS